MLDYLGKPLIRRVARYVAGCDGIYIKVRFDRVVRQADGVSTSPYDLRGTGVQLHVGVRDCLSVFVRRYDFDERKEASVRCSVWLSSQPPSAKRSFVHLFTAAEPAWGYQNLCSVEEKMWFLL